MKTIMKRILGLDLGTTSIGWANVIEGETPEQTEIKQIGVRVNPLTVDEQTNFEKGKPLITNADRTLKRGARRNLDRFKIRRKNLIEILINSKIIHSTSALNEDGKNTTFDTWRLRAKAATECVELNEFARVLLAINKKRGYKSSRKTKNEDDGKAVDGMGIAKKIYEENIDDNKDKTIPESVKLVWLEKDFSIRKDITPDNFKDEKSIDKIFDKKIKETLKERLKEFINDPKKAFSDLEKNPIWLNKEKGISVKRVTISGVSNAEALHYKKDHFGNFILDKKWA